MATLKVLVRKTLVQILKLFVGAEPRIHRIPFGPIRGHYIYLLYCAFGFA
jgi:hypothetical protein